MELGLTAGGGFFSYRPCVFASCSQIPLTQTASSYYRSANLEFSTTPTTDLTRAPTSWGLVVRLFRSRRIDHLAVCTPGVILEAVTTSVFPTCGAIPPTPPFVILHIALTCFRHSYLLFKLRIDLPHMYRRIVLRRHRSYYVFFSSHIGIYCIVLAITSI